MTVRRTTRQTCQATPPETESSHGPRFLTGTNASLIILKVLSMPLGYAYKQSVLVIEKLTRAAPHYKYSGHPFEKRRIRRKPFSCRRPFPVEKNYYFVLRHRTKKRRQECPARLPLDCPRNLKRDLEKIVKTEKTSKSDVIRDALEHYVALKRLQQRRKKVLPFAELKA
jgi:hypothetical protein